jgi:hypothetical protein
MSAYHFAEYDARRREELLHEPRVMAVEVRKGEPQYIGLDTDALAEMQGRLLDLEQCDSCGCTQYRVEGCHVVCDGSDFEVEQLNGAPQRIEGCGAKYPIRYMREDDIHF